MIRITLKSRFVRKGLAARLFRLSSLVALTCILMPGSARAADTEPSFVDGQIHCPDGSTRDYTGSGEPDTILLRLACQRNKLASPVQAAAPTSSDPMASLARDPLAEKGTVRCPDGTSRPYSGEAPSDLIVATLCSVSAEVAAERHRQAVAAVAEKDKAARQRAALNGDEGVWAGIKASWETGSLDYLLSFRLAWFIGIILAVLVLAKLFGSKR